ncbi:MAG: carbon-nitrogen hydrolase family protein [Chloroflexota bacterium]|nr:carbon-nitrogen hydrolase family protein [Chloroflexota bacterium]MDE2839641.1 carbon-nitrogen hydrolase family protein [Chloroflexota bacterium]MDE2930456.1 carbon-nitrogen hydrolase family protein [Chloroflexota bacterium]
MFTSIKVAAISLRPKKWDKLANAAKMERLIRDAATENPDVIVTIEGALEGYVVYDVIEGRRSAAEMLEIAEPLDGPYVARFRQLARELRVCLCFGFAERVGNEIYNTVVFTDHAGELCGTYQKSQFAEGTHPSWHFNRIGKKLRAFDTPFGRAGMLICNDRWNPLIPRAIVLDGAQILYIPTFGNTSKAQNQAVLARARENGVPIVQANVGQNLVVSKGEMIAYQRGFDKITVATVDIPTPPSAASARSLEREYLTRQGPEMERRYRETMAKLDASKAE